MILKQRHHAGTHHDVFDTRFYRRLRTTVGWAVRHRVVVLLMTLAIFVTSLWAFQFIPKNFFPQSSRPEILVDLWLPEGTSIKEVEKQAKALEERMMDDEDKRFIATYIGEGAPRFFLPLDQQLRNPNFAQLLVMAKDEPARERLIAKLRTILAEDFPSIRAKVDRLFLGPPTGWPVQMRVMGPDREEVRRIADQVKTKFQENPMLGAIHDDWLEPVPAMKLVIDQDRARALGITSQRIRQMLQAAMSGVPPTAPAMARKRSPSWRGSPAAIATCSLPCNQSMCPRFRWLRPGLADCQGGSRHGTGYRVAARPASYDHRARNAA